MEAGRVVVVKGVSQHFSAGREVSSQQRSRGGRERGEGGDRTEPTNHQQCKRRKSQMCAKVEDKSAPEISREDPAPPTNPSFSNCPKL